jgi:hypothetical protein
MTNHFADLLGQARARLRISHCAIEDYTTSSWSSGPDEPVSQRYVDETAAQLERLRAEGAPEDLELMVPTSVEYFDEDGQQAWARWEPASPETLRRVAAHAIVAYSLLRQEAEQQMVIALVALNRADSLEKTDQDKPQPEQTNLRNAQAAGIVRPTKGD